eukprot:9522452-Alexandrium_andersonii.AAC.1
MPPPSILLSPAKLEQVTQVWAEGSDIYVSDTESGLGISRKSPPKALGLPRWSRFLPLPHPPR